MKTKNLYVKNSLDSENSSALKFNEAIAEKIDLISSPLSKYFGITHVGHIKIFNNGNMFRVANNQKWTQKYFEKEYYNDSDLYKIHKISEEKTQFLYLTGEPQGEHLSSLCKDFDIWNALAIYEKFNTHTDFWFFGTSRRNTQALNFYINNLDLLKKFTLYFKHKLSDDLNKINSDHLIKSNLQIFDNVSTEKENIKNFFNKINIKSYKISENLSISKKELEVLYYLIQGKTLKEIAQFLDLSFRTIEFHLDNLKKKMKFTKKSQLIDFCLKNNIFYSALHKF